MNAQSKSLFSRTGTKIVLAVAIVAGVLLIFSGLVFNLGSEIAVQSRTGGSPARQDFASLPEYGYIQAHQARNALAGKAVAVTGFRALPEYGYIRAHEMGYTQAALLPMGLSNLAEFGYIQAHYQVSGLGKVFNLAAILPQGLRALPVFGYIEAHNRPVAETFVAGLPIGLRALPETDYIQKQDASRWRLQR